MEGVNANRVHLGHHLAVAAAYAACYELAKHFSFSHWILMSGLRLACLLLVPRKFWPALVVGEALPVIESAVLCIPDFGVTWGAYYSVPSILLCMPVISVLLRRMPLYGSDGAPRMPTILVATLSCALVTALHSDIGVLIAYLGRQDTIGVWLDEAVPDFMAYLLGNYLGALTLTPVVLALRQGVDVKGIRLRDALQHPMFRDIVLVAVPCIAILTVMARTDAPTIREVARLALVLPVVAATARHGWTGGAVAGMLSSIAMACTTTVLLDPAVIRAQVVLALAISGALVAGVRVTRRAIRTL
ncbi:MASE1 domain-containing protein [Luteibacter aegosomatis]|uniref:MASE1 domain-containing protein n=1 Tax=Luteibacter aegosomatis TaxID=2911537 RepID=UPI001FFAD16F|nr:MASE1 domain-containing protein [Luteibacter aegosomatis]UPG87706.1 MASE1 domain-containing protein [Luteibacter aegosomatis]